MTEIETCLNCKKPFCDDCIGSRGKNPERANRIEKVSEYIDRGMSIREMAKEMGLDRATVRYWIKKVEAHIGKNVER